MTIPDTLSFRQEGQYISLDSLCVITYSCLRPNERHEGGADMSKDMDRRDFLKTAAVTGTVFLAGDILQEGGLAQGLVKVPKAEAAEV